VPGKVLVVQGILTPDLQGIRVLAGKVLVVVLEVEPAVIRRAL
jgi:hypothetical protein